MVTQYLAHPVSSPVMAPSPLVQLGGVHHGQHSVPFAGRSLQAFSFYGLSGTSGVPEEWALRTPVPHDTTSAGPCRPDPEEDISGLLHCHGILLETSHLPVVNGGHVGSLSTNFILNLLCFSIISPET
jgi:hypothetical protein